MASRNFLEAQAGATTIEYALVAGVVGIAVGANQLGLAVTSNFQLAVDALHSLK